jgi:hypothetical protein
MGAAFLWQGFCILTLYILDEKKMMYRNRKKAIYYHWPLTGVSP